MEGKRAEKQERTQMQFTSFKQMVPSVNFHLWEPCNMRCTFCFATFQDVRKEVDIPKGHLPKEDCLSIVELLAQAGFQKINFAGGEPTLCPWLPDLIFRAKECGMTTSIVTNGSRITDQWLNQIKTNLDWIALSIDTVDPSKLKFLGRAVSAKKPISEQEYLHIAKTVSRSGMRLKINTVVTSETWQEDFTDFIRMARPQRWKILQALPVKGQNDKHISDLMITSAQFAAYVQRNRIVERDGIRVVPENNEMMTESYVMVDPAGRFFDNSRGTYTYSKPILRFGVVNSLKEVSVDSERFFQRGGIYEW